MTPCDKLGAVLTAFRNRLPGINLPILGRPEEDAFIGGMSLLRALVVQADAAHRLVSSGPEEAAAGNARQGLEAWADLSLMFRQGDPSENARIARAHGLLQMAVYYRQFADPADDELRLEAEENGRKLTALREAHPGAVATAEARGQYWSGLGRAAAVATAGELADHDATVLRGAYKLYSFEAHHIVTGARDWRRAELGPDRAEIGFGFHVAPEVIAGHCALLVHLLLDAWDILATVSPEMRQLVPGMPDPGESQSR